MGRKPNSLILANFVRGAKLDNNRYVQTCRSCGESFPKGRIEYLTKHLLEECPAAPLEHPPPELIDFHPPQPPFPGDTTMAVAALHQPLPPMALPFARKQSMSALDALAEVSRQHLDYRGTIRGSRGRMSSPNGYSPDDYLVSDDRHTEDGETSSNGVLGGHHTNGAQLPPIHNFNGMQPSPMNSQHLPSLLATTGALSTPRLVPSPLQMAAFAANELIIPNGGSILEPDISLLNNGPHDRPFNSPRQGSDWPIDTMFHTNAATQLPYPESPASRGPHLRPIAINPHTSPPSPPMSGVDMSSSPRSTKSKGRSRFTDSRRKEVKEVRKKGACMRCRMLKKPCSEGTPCSTCLNVESARLWKYPCIRSRVAEEFDLYGAGLYSNHGAFLRTTHARSRMTVRDDTGRIQVSHFPDASVFAVFPAVQGPLFGDGRHDDKSTWVQMIDTNTGIDVGDAMEQYMRRILPEFIKSETSPFMKLTLLQAYNLDPEAKPDSLISRVLELWVATVILTDPNSTFRYFLTHEGTPGSGNPESNIQVEQILNPDSMSTIEAQLHCAIEKRAVVYSKFIMNELERRLLQRQQANPFETFLVAIILLACTERMCWLFKTWEVMEDFHDSNRTSNPHTPILASNHIKAEDDQMRPQSPKDVTPMSPSMSQDYAPLPPKPHWPLLHPPYHWYLKGERFSDILQMLLRMRGVPPKTITQPSIAANATGLSRQGENVLHAVEQTPGPARPKESIVSRDWFEALGISLEEFQRRRESQWVRDDCRSWEGKFVSKLFSIAS